MSFARREVLKMGAAALLAGGATRALPAAATTTGFAGSRKADHTLRIGTGLVELAPDTIISTTTYNGRFPGPLIRFTEGRPVVVDVHNDTDTPEQLHWHGQIVPVSVDGSAEEGTPYIPAHGMRRLSFTPGPAGFRFYHTHVVPMGDLSKGQYGGQVGPVYIEPKDNPGAYDQEVFLVLKEFQPAFSSSGDMASDFLAGSPVPELRRKGESAMADSLRRGMPHGYEVGYSAFSINGRKLGHGEPIKVKAGQRVLFHVLNGSATEIRSLALPGHSFRVVALDGNPVSRQAEVPVLWIGTAERVSAVVEMNRPGVWVLGDLSDDDRNAGMGTVVQYTGHRGTPRWAAPPKFTWDYRTFAQPGPPTVRPDHVVDMLIEKRNAAADGFNVWTLNGKAFDMHTGGPVVRVERGGRYRLRFHNATDDVHPLHLHRATFDVTHIAGTPVHGLLKDVVMLGGYQSLALDFTADQPGLSLFHCHQQIHMDYGFMFLLRCA
ncbi:Multicopper oxidase with three cupredoxin domains (includes cell division protein FtsP and spore coat protein CotA) [Nonomuraea maritima]|uniref:Multicopper oxidase with three cupredoxin domains (Includes cell division protein FtsP and spore coat protein CotA) n=1 Tax=Nonomuraea maritima TaxID=683260 RepID=A0A1G8UAE3_9ACTN|nr:multicopper oxidase domain-containing protein [Nonomuraea maritima]SDJ49980.1 Multicopper oxidase with three cupredoxin domains (includes cell division protein FtsP and spore coat protein CotA) [Nonomuraea maritima]